MLYPPPPRHTMLSPCFVVGLLCVCVRACVRVCVCVLATTCHCSHQFSVFSIISQVTSYSLHHHVTIVTSSCLYHHLTHNSHQFLSSPPCHNSHQFPCSPPCHNSHQHVFTTKSQYSSVPDCTTTADIWDSFIRRMVRSKMASSSHKTRSGVLRTQKLRSRLLRTQR